MNAIEISLPAGMYSKDVVVRAAHRHSHACFVEVVPEEQAFKIRLTPRSEDADAASIRGQLNNDLLDESLRESVRTQTGAIQEVLLRAAVIGATGGDSP